MSNYMGLTTINSSDFVSPDPINNNFQKLDALGLDYVTEQGTSGEWWYRKWKSGRAECGIDSKQYDTVELHEGMAESSHEGFFFSDPLNLGAYPFSFASRPFAQVAFEGDMNSGSTDTTFPMVGMTHSTSLTASPPFWLMDFMPKTNMKPMFGIFVCGTYK